jgi:hypothetical protein
MCSNSKRTKQTLEAMSAVVSAFSTARTQFRGSLYSASALDGQTRSHLQVGCFNPSCTHLLPFFNFMLNVRSSGTVQVLSPMSSSAHTHREHQNGVPECYLMPCIFGMSFQSRLPLQCKMRRFAPYSLSSMGPLPHFTAIALRHGMKSGTLIMIMTRIRSGLLPVQHYVDSCCLCISCWCVHPMHIELPYMKYHSDDQAEGICTRHDSFAVLHGSSDFVLCRAP